MKRSLHVDTLRGVAIGLIIGFHVLLLAMGGDLFHWRGARRAINLWLYPLTLGWAGVPLFFVLSGYVIHLSFLRRGSFDLRSFARRRFWRIVPPYLVALAVFSIARRPQVTDFLLHLLFLHNLSSATFFGINSSFWSLAVEVQLYALYPVLLWLRARFGMRRALLVTLALSAATHAILSTFLDCPYPITAAWTMPPITWLDWTLGAYVAECAHEGRRAFRLPWLLPFAAFLAAGLWQPTNAWAFSLASLTGACLLDLAIHTPVPPGRIHHILAWLGCRSYGVYLWHQPIIGVIAGWLH